MAAAPQVRGISESVVYRWAERCCCNSVCRFEGLEVLARFEGRAEFDCFRKSKRRLRLMESVMRQDLRGERHSGLHFSGCTESNRSDRPGLDLRSGFKVHCSRRRRGLVRESESAIRGDFSADGSISAAGACF